MKKSNLKPQAMVMLPLTLADDVLLASEYAELFFDNSFDYAKENPEHFSKEEMESMKEEYDRIKILKEKFIGLMKEIYN